MLERVTDAHHARKDYEIISKVFGLRQSNGDTCTRPDGTCHNPRFQVGFGQKFKNDAQVQVVFCLIGQIFRLNWHNCTCCLLCCFQNQNISQTHLNLV